MTEEKKFWLIITMDGYTVRRQHIEDTVWWCTEVKECRLCVKYKVWDIGQSPEGRLQMSERYVMS